MAENTKIEWATHTFNPWVGCTKVSAACDHCYAESWAKRAGAPELWKGERRRTTPANWRKPLVWNRAARAAGERHRVFCASLADVFDNKIPEEWRLDLYDLIMQTPNLDWLLLTKRPQNIGKMTRRRFEGALADNIWIGTTVENQEEANRRIPHLLSVPARVHFLSCEPLLEDVDITRWLWGIDDPCLDCPRDADCECGWLTRKANGLSAIDWVICGGESGGGARLMAPEWAQSLKGQCKSAGTSFFMKQMTRKAEIPVDLLVREFPKALAA